MRFVFPDRTTLQKIVSRYYLALRRTQGSIRSDAPNWQPWLIFFLRAMQHQMKRLATKIEREKIVLSSLPDLSLRILDHARGHGRVSMGDIIKLTSERRGTRCHERSAERCPMGL